VLRRRFLKISGLSAASFLFAYTDPTTGIPYKAIRFPDTVSVRCGGAWYSLQGTDENWAFEDIQVSLRVTGDVVSLFVTAPHRELEFIQCTWKETSSTSSKYLADHWERLMAI
jgi:hypothetical protein